MPELLFRLDRWDFHYLCQGLGFSGIQLHLSQLCPALELQDDDERVDQVLEITWPPLDLVEVVVETGRHDTGISVTVIVPTVGSSACPVGCLVTGVRAVVVGAWSPAKACAACRPAGPLLVALGRCAGKGRVVAAEL